MADSRRIDVFTLFPEVIEHYADASILGRARVRGQLDLRTHDIRDAATDPHRSVDDAPFGGGAGMVLRPEPVFGAVERMAASPEGLARPLLLLSPSGRRFDQRVAERAGSGSEGSRCCADATRGWTSGWPTTWCDGELSVGDFVLAGGELAALVVVEAVARLLPGVLGNERSAERGELRRRAARVPPVHPAGRVPGMGGARGAALGRPRAGRPLAAGPGPGPHARHAPRPGRRPGRADPTRRSALLADHGEVRLLRDHGYDC